MEPTKETEEDIEANRVIEYYKKYAQNPDLLKYFTGTEASFVGKKISNFDLRKDVPPEIPKLVISENEQVQGEDQNILKGSLCVSPRNMQCQISPDVEIKIISEQEEIEEKNPSRSSSVASNKIEWDNGADIGYKNSYQFLSTRKSASFPSLLTNSMTVNSKVLPKNTPEKSASENIQELRKMYTQLTFSSETSSSTNKGDNSASHSKVLSAGSSSSQESKNMKISSKSSSSSDSYLRRKIGYPVAYSTPHEGSSSKESSSKSFKSSKSSSKPEGYTVTPMLTLPVKPKRNLIDDKQFITTENNEKIGNRKSSPEQLDTLNVIKERAEENPKNFQKRINLCLTKPISVECVSLESKKSVHKDVQTSFTSNKSSKCVQTEDVKFENLVSDQLIRCTPQTQNIEYVNFTDNSIQSPVAQEILKSFHDESSNSKKFQDLGRSNDEKNCKATQTDYVCSSKTVRSRRITCNDEESKNNKMVDIVQPLKKSKKKICYDSTDASSVDTSSDKKSTSVSVESTGSSEKNPVTTREYQTEEMLLAQMISLNYSNDLNTDIKRSIDVLQKLLKSKKYDQATKKYYIKKIVQKIVDSKYSDDSTSSDLFRPKKKSSDPKIFKETRAQTQIHKTTPKLMDNLPWYPVSEPIHMPKNENKKTEVKTVIVDNTKPTKDINNFLNTNVKRNQTFVLSKQEEPIRISDKKVTSTEVPLMNSEDVYPNYPSNKAEKKHFKQKLTEPLKKEDRNRKFVSNSSSKLIRNPVHENDNRPTSSEGKIAATNWRTAKTLSEKLLENRDIIDFKKGQGDYLLHVVKNERHHQLSWINNEIEHLVKLKELLEKKPDNARPDSKLNDVISSLLKMKVNDMKDIPKNFDVFICKCAKDKCDPDCDKSRHIQRAKRTASLTPGYYTIETKLDPDGNLLDLTVYDGRGNKKYNYQSDGIVDDVSISSKNHNTEVKLMPKGRDCPGQLVSGTHKQCHSCGRMFIPPSSDSEISLCEDCAECASDQELSASKDLPKNYKICKACGRMFIPSEDNPNMCICQKCYDEEPQPDKQETSLNTEVCDACGRLFIQKEHDSELCLCKRCKKKFMEDEKRSSRQKSTYNTCRICCKKFLVSRKNPDQNICEECLELTFQTQFKCACQKVTFSEPLEKDVCKCVTRDSPSGMRNRSPRKNKQKKAPTGEFCPVCGRELSQCICGPKFMPKKPKLIGNKGGEEHAKGSPCSHCIGVQANLPKKIKTTKYSSGNIQKKQSKIGAPGVSRSNRSILFEDEFSKYCLKACKGKDSQVSLSSSSSQSSKEFLKPCPRKVKPRSALQQQANKESCCKACSNCKTSRVLSPSPSTIRQKISVSCPKKEIPSHSPEGCSTSQCKVDMRRDSVDHLQPKKSCQCCTCTNCAVQTKKTGDKNVRCQCCICENCSTQVDLDRSGKSRKSIKSKWCQQKRSDTEMKAKSNQKFDKKKCKKDELERTDESLQSISSGNIICITPTKYKNMSKQKSDSECQCSAPKRRPVCDDQHKSLQICPSILKAICKSVNTQSQERTCAPCCPQASPDESRSCESLGYPCKPLKPKAAEPRENSSEASLTCPSKKSTCPAKPSPCPGAGDKPCPSYPPKPCPNRQQPTRDKDNASARCKSRGKSAKADRRVSECPALARRDSRNAGEGRRNSRENESILLPISIQSQSPLQEVHNSGNRKSDRSECSSRDLQTQDEVPSMSSNSPPNPVPAYSDNRQNIQVYTCTTQSQASANGFTEQKKCSCSLETCKCSQTATHEEKDVQCPASRQCTCQTEPKEDANIQCNCKEHAGVSCKCEEIYKETANFCQCKKSSSSSSSNSGSESVMSCICCKKEKILKNLINKIPLCEPCQEVNQKNFYPHNYCDPSHSCICYNLVNRDILCQFKQTLTELERLDIYQQYCEVLKNCKCCKKCGCKCKLPKKYKNGCAYFLKLEDACPNTHCEEEGSNSDFFCCEEEEEEDEEDRENYLPEVTVKVPNCKGPCSRKKKNEKRHDTKKYNSCPSIQSYLCTMKPEFVARAEHRRRILKDATSQREENSENRKLNFIEKINYLNQKKRNDKVSSDSNIYRPYGYQAKTYCVFDIELNDSPKKVQPRVFKSFKEMKDLTRRRYLHLTEVKSKKNVHREKRLREANRLLANTFTRRLQRSTLRGNVDIPLNVKVVSF